MPHQFNPQSFVLDTWRTDICGTDFALLTTGPAAQPLDNPVHNAPEVFQQRHMVHCSALGQALDNEELDSRLAPGSSGCELRLQAQAWPQPQQDVLLADLDADVLAYMSEAAGQERPAFVWLAAVPDEADVASLAGNLRGFLTQQLEHAARSLPAQAAALAEFAGGDAAAGAHPALRHPSWPSDRELAFELVATHAAAAAGSSPPFAGDSLGGPLQFELDVAEVVQRYAGARGCAPEQVQLAVLGTRQYREKRQHILVMCAEGDAGLARVFARPLQPVALYNQQQQEEAGEVVVQPDSDGGGMTWWLQSTMAPVAPDQERTLPWKTFLNLDPGAKGADAITAAAHSLGNYKWDALEVALYFPTPGTELQVPVSRVRLRRAAALRPCETGSVPRPEEGRAPSVEALERLAREGLPLAAAPELVIWLKEEGLQGVLQAVEVAGGIRKASPRRPGPAPL